MGLLHCGEVATLWVIKTIFAIGQQTIARLWMSCQVVGELPRCGDYGSGCGGIDVLWGTVDKL